ncbi:MAG: TatD family hydrolase [archaeon]
MIDAHCHLDNKAFRFDLDDVIRSAREWKVKAIMTSASCFSSNAKNLEIAGQYKGYVFACLGLDPTAALKEKKVSEVIEFIRENKESVVAIGEVGIDYYWEKEPDKQSAAFSAFISLAEELRKPLVVHARNSMDDVLKVLEKSSVPVMIHCFSGGAKHARECIDRGYFMSFATSACFLPDRKSLIKAVPLENMLAETDSPYNHPLREGRNEPKNVRSAYDLISDLKGADFSEVEKTIDKNACKLFELKLV